MDKLLQFVGIKPTLFPPNSRYTGIEIATYGRPDSGVQYLRRRFVPLPGRLAEVQRHKVVLGDRLDTISARYLGDPELFWRVCDANAAMRPEDLTADENTGRELRICMPEGIPGGPVVP
jgi:hypothetical protein